MKYDVAKKWTKITLMGKDKGVDCWRRGVGCVGGGRELGEGNWGLKGA